MTNILFLIAGIALGFYIKGRIQSSQSDEKDFDNLTKSELGELQKEAQEALTKRTERRKEKILDLIRNETLHQEELKICDPERRSSSGTGQITRADIEKLLDVSDGTARKYLNQLEKENKIRQVGDRGPDVYYVLNS